MKKLFTMGLLLSFFLSVPAFSQEIITIAQAVEDLDNDNAPDRLNDTVRVTGIVISPNYQTSNRSYYIYDGTAGITTFQNGLLSPDLVLGDSVDVTGVILHYNGLTEIDLLADTSLVVLSSGNEVPDPEILTIPDFFADPEEYESELVAFTNLTKKSGTWPAAGSSANLVFTNGTDTIVVRVDSDTDIDGQTEPTYPVDIIGVITQFKNAAPYTSGYQLQPRYYATDFLPGGSLESDVISIAEAVEDLDGDNAPDRLNDTVTVKGIVISPNYQTSNRSYYIYDGTSGIATFQNGLLSPDPVLGDEVEVTGVILHYNGLTEIDLLADTSLVILSSGNQIPDPSVLSITEFFADPEEYESELVAFTNLTKKSGTWPAAGGSANLVFTNGTDTIVVRVDSDTDIDGQTEPTYPVDIIGVITQFKNAAPYTSGYQLQPRYFATDFLPGGTLPVELISFSAKATGSSVKLSWSTASEKNNRGFEVERKNANGSFQSVGFVTGNGTTSQQQLYSFVDAELQNGTYSYRLKQVDFDGSYEYSASTEVTVNVPHKFALEQNFPNPFNPSTTIRFTLAADSRVNMKVFNVLGQEVSTLINSNYVAGQHEFKFNASNLNSGVYFYKLVVNGIDGSSFSSVKKMILTK